MRASACSRAARRRSRSTGWAIPARWARPSTSTSSATTSRSRPTPRPGTRKRCCACRAISQTTASASSTTSPSRAPILACRTMRSCSAASTPATSSRASPSTAGWRSCAARRTACSGCSTIRPRPTSACVNRPRRAALPDRVSSSRPSCPTRATLRAIRWPTCSSIPCPMAPTPRHLDALWMGVPVLTWGGGPLLRQPRLRQPAAVGRSPGPGVRHAGRVR